MRAFYGSNQRLPDRVGLPGTNAFNRNADRILKNAITGVSEQRSGKSHRRDQDLLRDRLVKVLYGEASLLYFLAELKEFSNLGKGAGTMKVPYAKKWQKETDKLRQIALDCELTEELKWGKPCFTFLKKNVAIVIPLKESCAFSFFKGTLLKDPKHVLERIGEHTLAGRWIKFTSLREIAALRSTVKDYLYEAIELEESGTKIDLKKPSEYPIPEELKRRLDDNAVLRAAKRIATLTPGRRKSHIFHISSAKQAKTRAARAEKCVPMILSGRGFNELPN